MMSIWGGDIRYSVHFGGIKYLGEEKRNLDSIQLYFCF